MAALVRSSADAIVGATLDGIITDWNQAAERLFGYTAEEAIGQPLEMLAPPERAHEVYALLARARRGECIEEIETVRWAKDGRLIDVSLTIWPVRNDAGLIIAASANIRNITERKAAEAALAATHQQTHQMLERISDGIYALDRDWRFTYVNEAAEGVFGRTREELFGKILWEEFLPLVETPLYAACQEALAKAITTNTEFLYPPLDAWFEARAYPSPDGLSVLIRNTSAPRQHGEDLPVSEAKFRELVEHLPAVVYLLAADEQQAPLYFSPRLQELTGYRPREILSQTGHWLEAVHPDDRERVAAEEARTKAVGEPFRLEYRRVRKDGTQVWVRDEREAIRDEAGQIVAWQGMLHDVTERKQFEHQLKEALDAAETGDRAKNHFLTMMSHELRTPLQAVLGYADFLLSDQATSLTPDQAEDIGCIRKGASRMVTLIEQILDMSRLGADRLDLMQEPIDLAEIIEQVRQDVAPQAAAKSLDVQIEVPESLPQVLGDRVQLRQILLNLAANAVKFTEAGSLRITASASDDGVDVAVSDTGTGIPAEALEHIFEEFWQADSDIARRSEGAGLGLAIAKKLAEHMGGRIQVESRPGAGSTFTLHLTAS
jgi:PAS domain S-box-containing protein